MTDKVQKKFGECVRTLRRAKGLSQEALAEASDLDRSYIGGVERGERNISLQNIIKIANGIGISASEIFKDFNDKH